jgi:tRNA-uridine aminocarboxypropyltransferase
MTKRSRLKPRCGGCGLKPESCVCAELPRVRLATPMVVVQHVSEAMKPTNTVRLLSQMLDGLTVLPYGMREPPFDPGPLVDPAIEWVLLLPRDDARELAPPQPGDRPRGFVLLDGTWHQCTRMSRRVPVVRELPCVALPPGPSSIWAVRTQHDERGMSTFEAATRALATVEGDEAVRPMLDAFARVTARLLFLKGKLRSPEVPSEWLRG